MRILLTCFEPFGGDTENASREAVLRLADRWADETIQLRVGCLPVAFATAPTALAALVAEHAPDAVLAVGEAGGRTAITPERRGRNRVDARIPDALGAQPRDVRIDDGPDQRASRLDVDAMVAALVAAGLPAAPSDDAGGYLCNQIAYLVGGLEVPGGFVHVPAVRSRGAATVGAETDPGAGPTTTGLDVDDLASALEVCVRSIVAGARVAAEDRPAGAVR